MWFHSESKIKHLYSAWDSETNEEYVGYPIQIADMPREYEIVLDDNHPDGYRVVENGSMSFIEYVNPDSYKVAFDLLKDKTKRFGKYRFQFVDKDNVLKAEFVLEGTKVTNLKAIVEYNNKLDDPSSVKIFWSIDFDRMKWVKCPYKRG